MGGALAGIADGLAAGARDDAPPPGPQAASANSAPTTRTAIRRQDIVGLQILAITQSRRVRLRSRARFVAAKVAPMTDPLAAEPEPSDAIDAAMMRRLLLHEARVHAIPGRDLRDLGDSILLHDPAEREPFWNRLEGLRWPDDPGAFDKRLTEVLVLFASIGRTPHIWASPLHDSPADLASRLEANGFRDMGMGNLMLLVRPRAGRHGGRRADPRRRLDRALGRRHRAGGRGGIRAPSSMS